MIKKPKFTSKLLCKREKMRKIKKILVYFTKIVYNIYPVGKEYSIHIIKFFGGHKNVS